MWVYSPWTHTLTLIKVKDDSSFLSLNLILNLFGSLPCFREGHYIQNTSAKSNLNCLSQSSLAQTKNQKSNVHRHQIPNRSNDTAGPRSQPRLKVSPNREALIILILLPEITAEGKRESLLEYYLDFILNKIKIVLKQNKSSLSHREYITMVTWSPTEIATLVLTYSWDSFSLGMPQWYTHKTQRDLKQDTYPTTQRGYNEVTSYFALTDTKQNDQEQLGSLCISHANRNTETSSFPQALYFSSGDNSLSWQLKVSSQSKTKPK